MPALADPKKLSVIRSRRGLTQSALGRKIGKSQGDISLYETGQMKPMNETLKKIAEVLGYTGDPETLLDPYDIHEDLSKLLKSSELQAV